MEFPDLLHDLERRLLHGIRDILSHLFHPFESKLMSALTDLAANIATLNNDTVPALTTAVNALVAQGQSGITDAQLAPLNEALTQVNSSLTTLVGVINGAVTPAA